MKILIATALFPPDVADPAPYVKELTRRLQEQHDVSVLTYGHIPEQVSDARIVAITKMLPAPVRLLLFTWKLLRMTKRADFVLVQNAPSTELPVWIVGILYKRKLILEMSDKKISYTSWKGTLHTHASKRVLKTLRGDLPQPRPEILPFTDPPTEYTKTIRS